MKKNLDKEALVKMVLERDEYMFTSPEYMRGVVEGIEYVLTATPEATLYCPFDGDSAEGDAWKHGSMNGMVVAAEQRYSAGEELDASVLWS